LKKKLVVGMIVRNEEKRYLKRVLTSINNYQSEKVEVKVIIVDDASTDETPKICSEWKGVPLRLICLKERLFNKNEAELRTSLWEEIRKEKPDWVLIQDADEEFEKAFARRLPEFLNSDWEWISFHWCDMWDENHYRVDGFWSPLFRRLFKFQDLPYDMDSRKIHCSPIPKYVVDSNIGTAYSDIRVKHLGWIGKENRKKKSDWYSKFGGEGINKVHASTILDLNPTLKEFKEPFELPKVLIGIAIRNREWCLKEFLSAIEGLDYPKKKIGIFFIANNCTDKTIPILKEWSKKVEKLYSGLRIEMMNFKDPETKTREWSQKLLMRMAYMRNKLLTTMVASGYDYLFNLDSDIILRHRETLKHLVCLDREVVAETTWATWGKIDYFPLPTIWRFGNYGGVDEDFMALLRKKGTYRVGGLGACNIISKSAANKGASFVPVLNLPQNMRGEDRQFCVRCAVNNIYLWADSYFTPQHLEKEIYDLRKMMFEAKQRRTNEHRISLCMMVKNEEIYLDEFLYRMSPLFDEIIILDTGSKDKTLEIARKYTSKIFHYKWKDNFSEARNELKKHATCPWIFYADPDETYTASRLYHFDNMVQMKDSVAFAFIVYNFRGGAGKASVSESVRLFRNLPELYFTGRVHETLDEALEKYIKQHPNMKLRVAPIKLLHWGFAKGRIPRAKKIAYYRGLDQRQIKELPKDPRGYFNFALHLLEEGKRRKAVKLLKKAITLNSNFVQPKIRLGLFYLEETESLFEDVLKRLPKGHPRQQFIFKGIEFLRNYLEGKIDVQSEGIGKNKTKSFT